MVAVNYDWDEVEDNINEEYDDSGSTIAEYTTEPALFGNVISQRRGGQSSFLHCDGLGSTLALTNAAGTITDTNSYTAFGEVTEQAGGTVNPLRYVGQKEYYRDEEIGDYLVRRRPLLAVHGRWVTVDPIGTIQSYVDGYHYTRNNPLGYYDPSGLQEEEDSCAPKEKPCCKIHRAILLLEPHDWPASFPPMTVLPIDKNRPGPVWDEARGLFSMVHWLVIEGERLEKCKYIRWVNGLFKSKGKVVGKKGSGYKPAQTLLTGAPDGPILTQFDTWIDDETSILVFVDAPTAGTIVGVPIPELPTKPQPITIPIPPSIAPPGGTFVPWPVPLDFRYNLFVRAVQGELCMEGGKTMRAGTDVLKFWYDIVIVVPKLGATDDEKKNKKTTDGDEIGIWGKFTKCEPGSVTCFQLP